MFYIDDDHVDVARVKVIGVGGGGGNALNTMINAKLDGVEFIAANTDKQSLESNMASIKVQLGRKSTKGLGAGGKPEVGKEAAIEDEELLKKMLIGADMVFITAGMGGGTGTGAAPIIAKVAKDLDILTVAVVTKPFLFEGPKRQKQAEKGLRELKSCVDTLITIPNQRLLNIIGEDTSLIDGFKKVDEVLLQAVKGISDLINKTGFINLDFADVKSVMSNKGVALMGIGVGRGENRAKEAAVQAMTSPLLENISVEGATGIIVNITAGSNLPMKEITEATAYVTEAADESADVIFGVVIDDKMGEEIRLTVVATGFSSTSSSIINENQKFDLILPSSKKSFKKDDYEEFIDFNVKKYVEKRKNVNYGSSSLSTGIIGNTITQEEEWDIPTFIRKSRE